MDACKEKGDFKFLYPTEMPLRQKIETIAREVYGADGVVYTPEAEAKAKAFEADPRFRDYHVMMVKTHLSLTHDPTRKGVPKGWDLAVRDFLLYSGAKYICPCTGTISLMPALCGVLWRKRRFGATLIPIHKPANPAWSRPSISFIGKFRRERRPGSGG